MAQKMNRTEFVNYIVKLVTDYRKTAKVEPDFFDSVTIAQAIHETGYGASELYLGFNNAFGYKAKPGEWSGKVAGDYKSDEEINGVVIKDVPSDFRAYDSVAQSVADHANMMTRLNGRYLSTYQVAIDAKTPEAQAHALTGRYAGDSNYGTKLVEIMDALNLYQYDTEIKENKKMAYIGLDIGHGANTWETGGGKGVYAYGKSHEEHTFNSIVARKLKLLLEASGHKVTYGVQQPMANETGLKARTNRFNSEKVDIMVSIHANWIGSFGNATNGIAAFYAGYSAGSRQTNSKKLADLIMNAYRKQGQEIYHGGSVRSYVGNWTNFHMTREVSMPAVLMELGFMSGSRDFDKVFGSQQDKYTTQMAQGMADGINAYFGVASKPVDKNNPQGMKTTPMKEYKAPSQEFSALKEGDLATLAPNWQWADLDKQELLQSERYAELLGKSNKVLKVKDITDLKNRNHSNRAYLIDGWMSWILEEYVVESKRDWKDGIIEVEEPKEQPETDDDYDIYPFELGYVKVRKTNK